jgi:hypothetical protein
MFVGVFGLDTDAGCPPVVDLCGVVDGLLDDRDDHRTGHELLIALANRNYLAHITKYIQTKLNDDQARIVYIHLRRHPERVGELVNAIPSQEKVKSFRTVSRLGGVSSGAAVGMAFGPIGGVIGGLVGGLVGNTGAAIAEDHAVDNSDGLKLARRIWDEWWQSFANILPRPVADVVDLLQRLQEHPVAGGRGKKPGAGTLLDTLRRYMYGWTPMRDALTRSLAVFRKYPIAEKRILVLVSDGVSTDGDPLPLARELQEANVSIAAVYLTGDRSVPRRRLYDQAAEGWNAGQRTLFRMADRVAGATHPIPVLASMGWDVPSSGECALYATVCSAIALDEFFSLLLSARFGSADVLLDIIGRVQLDEYVNDEQVRTRKNPSNQGDSMTCYAHAIAAILHMALLRIVGREGGYPSIEEIRERIEARFPPGPGGRVAEEVLRVATAWYRPLRFRKVDEEGARQAVLHRRPVLSRCRPSRLRSSLAYVSQLMGPRVGHQWQLQC